MTDTTLQTLSIMRCWKAKNVLDQYAFPCLKQYTVRDDYMSCEVGTGPGAAGRHEVKPEEA